MLSTRKSRQRRAVLVILVVLIGFLTASLWGIIRTSTEASAVVFGVERTTPNEPDYCPGDTMTYTVTVSVDHPAVLEITETWCEKGIEGRCSASLSRTWKQAALEPRLFTAEASRRIPDDPFFRPGGTYQLYHAVIDGRPAWYIVDNIHIGADCP